MTSSLCNQGLPDDLSCVNSLQRNASTSALSHLPLANDVAKHSKQEKPENVFRIVILSTFNKMTSLPSMSVWTNLTSTLIVSQNRLTVQVRSNGFLPLRDNKWITCHCLLSNRGYFVIYANESLCQGYAASLFRAKKLDIVCERVEQKDGSHKVNCTVILKWKYGTINVKLEENQVEFWRQSFINYFEGHVIESHLNKLAVDSNNLNINNDNNNFVVEKPLQETNKINHTSLNNLLKTKLQQANYSHIPILKKNQELGTTVWTGDKNSLCSLTIANRKFNKNSVNLVQRHCSDGALTFTPRSARYNKDQKLPMDLFNSISADVRFRRAKQYFETGVHPLVEENRNESS